MNALSIELRDVIAKRVAVAGSQEILAITTALCSVDLPAVTIRSPRPDTAARFEIIDDDLVIDHSTGLTWLRGFVPGGRRTYDESMAAASAFRLRNWQFRSPTIQERISITDYARHNPAIDTAVFHSERDGWEWTATLDSESPRGCAWFVNFSNGGSGRYNRDGSGGFVRAVRVGQF